MTTRQHRAQAPRRRARACRHICGADAARIRTTRRENDFVETGTPARRARRRRGAAVRSPTQGHRRRRERTPRGGAPTSDVQAAPPRRFPAPARSCARDTTGRSSAWAGRERPADTGTAKPEPRRPTTVPSAPPALRRSQAPVPATAQTPTAGQRMSRRPPSNTDGVLGTSPTTRRRVPRRPPLVGPNGPNVHIWTS